MIEIGGLAPDFTLPGTRGEVRLSALCQRGAVVLVFFVEAATPDCSRQLQPFIADYSTIRGLGAEIVAISADPLSRLEEFAEKVAAPFSLACDLDLVVARLYDIANERDRRTERAVFVVGSRRELLHVNRDYIPANPAEYEAAVMALAG